MTDRYSRFDLVSLSIPGDPASPVRQASEEFLHSMHVRNYSVRTIELRRKYLTLFARWCSDQGVDDLNLITRTVLEQFRSWLHAAPTRDGRPREFSTQSLVITAIRRFFHYLVTNGRIPENPALYLEHPRQARPLPTPVLTKGEVDRILAQPDLTTWRGVADRAMLEVLFATGIRRQEVACLSLDDVDFQQHTLTVHHGKGKKARMVPISDRALSWVSSYLAVRPAGATSADDRGLFLTNKRQMWGLVGLTRKVTGYVKAAGVTKRGSCHMFRATTATMMLEAGADIRFIQEMLGHTSILATQRYTRVSVSALQRVYANTHPSAVETAPTTAPPTPRQRSQEKADLLPLFDDV